jgi:F420-non-reducing hydrogenase iron-sulfur subunit
MSGQYAERMKSMEEFEPKIVAFFCNWCSYCAADLAGSLRIKYPPTENVTVIRLMCSGGVDERLILKAFAAGADGILICGCHIGECHYTKGNVNARRRVTGWRPLLDVIGIGQDRLMLAWIGASEGPEMAETVKSFIHTIKGLGPSPFNRRQNEH